MADEHGHILVVDDNRLNRVKLSRGLEQQGHRVALAENGRRALEMVRAEPFD
jgi:adenylate cyclase